MKQQLVSYIRDGGGGGGGGAVGGAVGLDNPAGFLGKVAEDFVDVCAGGEAVAAVLAEAVEDVGGDGPPLPLSHLRPLSLHRTSPAHVIAAASDLPPSRRLLLHCRFLSVFLV